jgi:mono/diheme cytochrome c family protein
MRRRIETFAIPAVILFLAAQVYRPARTNPPSDRKQEVRAILDVHPQVASAMDRSCGDCHSNRTVWPWYSRVAPVSWLVVSDVNRGRAAVNFSEWSKYNAQEQQKHLEEICSEVSQGEMPALQHTLMHPDAKLIAAEKAAICQWTKSAGASKSVALAVE